MPKILRLSLFAMLLCWHIQAEAQTSFAILNITRSEDVPAGKAVEAYNGIYKYFLESGKYQIVDRQQLEKVLAEQSLQQSGMTDSTKMTAVGKLLGVDKLVSSSISMSGKNNYHLKISVTDVATAQVELAKDMTGEHGASPENVAKWCVGNVINEYPLVGKVVGKAKNIIVVSLGKANGMKTGDRLFVARKEPLIGDDGKVLITEYNRIGILEIEKSAATSSQTKVVSLTVADRPVKQDDLVSPEPIPKLEANISYTAPLLPNIGKGKLLLDDNMEVRTNLAVLNNTGPSYLNGKLQLNATNLSDGGLEAYCSYPAGILGELDNFIMEGEFTFKKIKDKWNKLYLGFRLSGDHGTSDSYSLYFNQMGYFEVIRTQKGTYFGIIPYQNSSFFNAGEEVNRFRIIAYNSSFDIYLNDNYLVGFEDEYIRKGTIGFQVKKGSWATIDNVKIWEAVKKK